MAAIYTFQVEWGDTDAAGIVFYPNFYKWMDNATHELFEMIGFPTNHLFAQEQVGLPILEAHCEFQRPAFFRQRIKVVTEVIELRDKVFRLNHTFWRDDAELARGYEVRAWTSFMSGKPKAVSIPEKVREALQSVDTLGTTV